jgi:hypothetical protein
MQKGLSTPSENSTKLKTNSTTGMTALKEFVLISWTLVKELYAAHRHTFPGKNSLKLVTIFNTIFILRDELSAITGVKCTWGKMFSVFKKI